MKREYGTRPDLELQTEVALLVQLRGLRGASTLLGIGAASTSRIALGESVLDATIFVATERLRGVDHSAPILPRLVSVGAPMKAPEDRLTHMVGIRLTDAGKAALQRVCDRLKTTPTELVRSLVSRLDKRPDIQRIEDVA